MDEDKKRLQATDAVTIDVSRIIRAAVLVPIDIDCESTAMRFRASGIVANSWWNELIRLDNEQVQVISPPLLGFLEDAKQVWSASDDNVFPVSILVELQNDDGSSGRLQALAGKQDGNCFLLIRDLDMLDGLFTKSITAIRSKMLDQSKERSQHQRQVETISADRDEARRLEQAKSEFLANMSHEVRTPLTTILGMASMAQSTIGQPDRQEEFLNGVVNAAQRLLRLSNDILDLSRLQAEKLELDRVPFSLHQLMLEFEGIWKLHASRKSLAFNLELGEDVPDHVVGDSFRLQQVLTNLVSNALKFTEEGGITLRVAAGTQSGAVSCSVIDTGVGITEKQQLRIFETFTQVDESATRRHQGAGLGLAIASKLVRIMGSTIQVESQRGLGSRFFFDVVLPVAHNVPAPNTTQSARHQSTPQIRVLVAEDHEINRSIIVEILEAEGFTVLEAADGAEALNIYREEEVDVVLMDCQMPVMSGLEAIAEIRTDEEGRDEHVPIIALTAHAMREEQQRLLDSGADRYMSKPFERESLISLVRELASLSDTIE